MFRWVGERKNHRSLGVPRNGLNHPLRECAADRADADDGCGLDAFNGTHEISGGCMFMRIYRLKIDQVCTGGLEQTIHVEKPHAGLSLLKRESFLHHCRTKKVSESDTRRAGAQEEI